MSQLAVMVANTVWEPLSLALLTPSNPAFFSHLHSSSYIVRLFCYFCTESFLYLGSLFLHSLLPSLTPHPPFVSGSLVVPCVVSLVPPFLWAPLGLGDFAFVCDSGVSEARGGVEVWGLCPKLWGENNFLIASCLFLCQRLCQGMDSWACATTP